MTGPQASFILSPSICPALAPFLASAFSLPFTVRSIESLPLSFSPPSQSRQECLLGTHETEGLSSVPSTAPVRLAREMPTPAPLLAHTLPVRFPAALAAARRTEKGWGGRESGRDGEQPVVPTRNVSLDSKQGRRFKSLSEPSCAGEIRPRLGEPEPAS